MGVEPLNRALAIQYWVGRYGPSAPKSWIMVAVKSNKKAGTPSDPKATSALAVTWHRDGKEVRDADIPFDIAELSTEALLKAAISRHVEYILTTIHGRLAPTPRFVKREAAMMLHVSKTEPIESRLKLQFGISKTVELMIEPITGIFAINPHTRWALVGEARLNSGGVDPADDGVGCIESMRKHYLHEEFNRRGRSLGWGTIPNPLGPDDIKRLLNARETPSTFCFQRQGWDPKWYVLMALSLSGDEWWLFEQ